MLNHGVSLTDILTWFREDLPVLSEGTILRSLIWFKDAETQPIAATLLGCRSGDILGEQ